MCPGLIFFKEMDLSSGFLVVSAQSLHVAGFPRQRPGQRRNRVHLTQARGKPVPCRSDARFRRPAFRSLDAGSFSASLPSRRQQRRLHGTGSPLANPVSVGEDPIKAPWREPGGRRAVGRETPPEALSPVHDHNAQSAITGGVAASSQQQQRRAQRTRRMRARGRQSCWRGLCCRPQSSQD